MHVLSCLMPSPIAKLVSGQADKTPAPICLDSITLKLATGKPGCQTWRRRTRQEGEHDGGRHGQRRGNAAEA